MVPDRPRRRFHEQLDLLQNRLLEMAGQTEELVAIALDGVVARDASITGQVIERDDVIDEMEIEIDELALELLALQQPMAVDLRQIITTLKVSNDLERVGDHAVNIARATLRLADAQPLPELPEVAEISGIARRMLADSLGAYTGRDPELARDVCERDDRVDNLRRSLYRILVSHMLEEPRRITAALEYLLVAQNIERIADLSTNISEDVVFLVEGRTIKHNVEARESDVE
ncbi:MAG: phosphate signaling complex protein PhoU [Gemmatimonadota bacterium]